MYLWKAQLFIFFLFNSYSYSTACPSKDEYAPTFFGKIANWFRNLKDRIVGFFNGSPPPAPQDDCGTITNSSIANGSPSLSEKLPENDAEKNTFETSTTTESVTSLSSEKSIDENTEVKKTSSTPKAPQSAEVIEP
ncbi:GSCOCG00005835001-RA-CDS [Cotesia congregata]|uniref:Uncharacterized protein n=1 Tax=Cotesia congregata TaxID=51543 RepID=A0A8J2HRF4_COTCN|nr:GSCOCG00005835001-RA-CDS [Cotesia congregata]CAG5107995.1 Protein of unknown function [Cotesia congregata]